MILLAFTVLALLGLIGVLVGSGSKPFTDETITARCTQCRRERDVLHLVDDVTFISGKAVHRGYRCAPGDPDCLRKVA